MYDLNYFQVQILRLHDLKGGEGIVCFMVCFEVYFPVVLQASKVDNLLGLCKLGLTQPFISLIIETCGNFFLKWM